MEKPGVKRRLSAAGVRQRRHAGVKHGLKAQVVTPDEIVRYKLEKLDPDGPEIIDRYVAAQTGDLSVLDRQVAAGLASTEILRRKTVERIAERGVDFEEAILNAEGVEVARRVKANPLLDHLKWMGEQQGYTAKQAQVSRESRPRSVDDDERVKARLARDEHCRATTRLMMMGVIPMLPPPDLELLREAAAREKDPEVLGPAEGE